MRQRQNGNDHVPLCSFSLPAVYPPMYVVDKDGSRRPLNDTEITWQVRAPNGYHDGDVDALIQIDVSDFAPYWCWGFRMHADNCVVILK